MPRSLKKDVRKPASQEQQALHDNESRTGMVFVSPQEYEKRHVQAVVSTVDNELIRRPKSRRRVEQGDNFVTSALCLLLGRAASQQRLDFGATGGYPKKMGDFIRSSHNIVKVEVNVGA